MTAGKVDPDGGESLANEPADLDQPKTQGVELHPWYPKLDQPVAQGVQEPVGRGMQQEPELVGHKRMVAQPIAMAGALEVLDAVLGRTTPLDIPVVEGERIVGPVGDDEAGIGSLLQRFRL